MTESMGEIRYLTVITVALCSVTLLAKLSRKLGFHFTHVGVFLDKKKTIEGAQLRNRN